ncbi:hypothetical protein [Bradyrhizobium sp. SZCCHNR1070]|uniref:hypothetical protein n=1 Tax=Bradyrhizobium sp. SZCCHNR1070 TaxID=3057361 RepID=UPI002916F1C7|nr:hypothetical protein [Bradyrhizobium sp. SZCCHNR1070]
MAKAAASGITLGYRDTCIVKGMLARGDRQHDIASYFGVNSGRIAEIATGGGNYPNAQPSPDADLPPEGPYLTRYAVQSVIATLNEAIEALDMAEAEEDIADVKAAIVLARETVQQKLDALEEA